MSSEFVATELDPSRTFSALGGGIGRISENPRGACRRKKNEGRRLEDPSGPRSSPAASTRHLYGTARRTTRRMRVYRAFTRAAPREDACAQRRQQVGVSTGSGVTGFCRPEERVRSGVRWRDGDCINVAPMGQGRGALNRGGWVASTRPFKRNGAAPFSLNAGQRNVVPARSERLFILRHSPR